MERKEASSVPYDKDWVYKMLIVTLSLKFVLNIYYIGSCISISLCNGVIWNIILF